MAKLNLTKILTESGALVAGGVGSNLVAKNLPIENDNLKMVAPIALGVYLSHFTSSPLLKNLGAGMIAVQGTAIAKSKVPGLAGVGEEVMMGEVMMGETYEDPMMGSVPFSNDALSTTGAYDFTSAGEMQF